jgi:CDP-diacylglycerol--serine O-phosphatidyltransferase
MNIKKHIPNAITCGNLLCGCLAIIKIFEGNLILASYFVGVALILDFFDGFTARILNVSSPIGKDLDSLADLVTFGVVPGLMMFKIIEIIRILNISTGSANEDAGAIGIENSVYWPPYFALVIPIFSAIRLAKFNNDTRQSDSFIGLPTPANAMLICSLPLVFNLDYLFFESENNFLLSNLMLNPTALIVLSLLMSFLLVSELPLIALKFKNFGWSDNKIKFIFIALCMVLILFFQLKSLPLIIILYILLSIVNNIFFKKKV